MNQHALNVNEALESSLAFIERVTTKSGKGVTSRNGVDGASAIDLDSAWARMYGDGENEVAERAMEIFKDADLMSKLSYHNFNGDTAGMRSALFNESGTVIDFMIDCFKGATNASELKENIKNKGATTPVSIAGILLNKDMGKVFRSYLMKVYSIKPFDMKLSTTKMAYKISDIASLCAEYREDDKNIVTLDDVRADEVSKARKVIIKLIKEVNPDANIVTDSISALSSHGENAALWLWLERGLAVPSIESTIARKLYIAVCGLKCITLYGKFISLYCDIAAEISHICHKPGTCDMREMSRFTSVFDGAQDMISNIAAMHGDDFSFLFDMLGISPYTLRMTNHVRISNMLARLRTGKVTINDDGVLVENKSSDCGGNLSHEVSNGSTVAVVNKGKSEEEESPAPQTEKRGDMGPLFDFEDNGPLMF